MHSLRIGLTAIALAGITIAAAGAAAPKTLTVKMNALNGSGQSGTATLTDTPDGVQIAVKLDGSAKAGDQPTHIHAGTCGNIDKAPEWPLKNTTNGTATSVVPKVTIAQLLASHYAINVHKSTSDLATYVSCGDITAAAPAK